MLDLRGFVDDFLAGLVSWLSGVFFTGSVDLVLWLFGDFSADDAGLAGVEMTVGVVVTAWATVFFGLTGWA